MAVDALSQNPTGDIDENEFIDASRLVYDGVRDIRQAVLMNRVCVCHVKHMESALMLSKQQIRRFLQPKNADSFLIFP